MSTRAWLSAHHDIQKFVSCSLSQRYVQRVGICRDSALRFRCPLVIVVGGRDRQAGEEGCRRHVYGAVKHRDIAFLERCDIAGDFWKITVSRLAAQSCRGLAFIQDAADT